MAVKPLVKLQQRMDTANTLVCVGLDSEFEKLPDQFRTKKYPQFAFNKWVIEHTHNFVCAYKPNTAFYEVRGAAGITELQMTMEFLHVEHPEIFTIIDAKRGDIGNTSEMYAHEAFDTLGGDALTITPYLGREALQPFLERDDKVSIIVCRTSNPGAGEFQDAQMKGKPLWQHVAQHVRDEWNVKKNCMLVAGATYPQELAKLREMMGEMTFLVPGIGAQGGDVKATVKAGVNMEHRGIIVNSARGIIFSDDPAAAAQKLRDEINEHRKGSV